MFHAKADSLGTKYTCTSSRFQFQGRLTSHESGIDLPLYKKELTLKVVSAYSLSRRPTDLEHPADPQENKQINSPATPLCSELAANRAGEQSNPQRG